MKYFCNLHARLLSTYGNSNYKRIYIETLQSRYGAAYIVILVSAYNDSKNLKTNMLLDAGGDVGETYSAGSTMYYVCPLV